MTRFFVGLSMVLVAVCAGVFGVRVLPNTSHPPHAVPPVAEVAIGPLPLEVVGGDSTIGAVVAFVQGVERYEQEQAAQAAERFRAARSVAGVSMVGGGTGEGCAALAAELGLPESVLWRESRCSWDAYNATGCGGRGCLGPAQVDAGHFAERSPWNANASSACFGLDPNDPGQYAECVGRLSSGGTNLAPWR